MTAEIFSDHKKKGYQLLKLIRPLLGGIVGLFLVYRLYIVLIVDHPYGPDTWTRLLIAGLILGGVYSLIAIGYTLVYGILFMGMSSLKAIRCVENRLISLLVWEFLVPIKIFDFSLI